MENKQKQHHTFSQVVMKVIGGSALGIIVAVIPNAIFGQIFGNLVHLWSGFGVLNQVVQMIQLLMPVLIGVGVGMQFEFNPMQILSIGAAAFIGSGNVSSTEAGWHIAGVGDTVNTMLTAGIGVGLLLWLGEKMKPLATIAYPTVIGLGAGAVGLLTLPYVSSLTQLVGHLVARATELQPMLMGMIISMIFAILIITPISVVAVALAISLSGIGSGAGNLGTVATVVFMAIGSMKAHNSFGITLSILLGGVKTMMPNFFKKPKIGLPIIVTAAILGALGVLLNIQGTPASAGFGFAGLVGPIVAYGYLDHSPLVNSVLLILIYAVIPIGLSLFAHWLFTDILHITDHADYTNQLD